MNGFTKADQSMRIGEQEIPFFRKCLSKISQFSKQIPCLDVFIVKKYTPYFLEEIVREEGYTGSRFILRNRRTMDRLTTVRNTLMENHAEKEWEKIRAEAEKSGGNYTVSGFGEQSEMDQKKDQIKNQLDDMRR